MTNQGALANGLLHMQHAWESSLTWLPSPRGIESGVFAMFRFKLLVENFQKRKCKEGAFPVTEEKRLDHSRRRAVDR